MEDGRCKLGLAGRLQLVRLIEGGCSFRAAAAESSVSVATAHRWCRAGQDESRAGEVGGFGGLSPFDDLEGPAASWLLAAQAFGAQADQPAF